MLDDDRGADTTSVVVDPGGGLAVEVEVGVTQARGLPWGELQERTFDGIATVQRVAELDPARVTGAPERFEAG